MRARGALVLVLVLAACKAHPAANQESANAPSAETNLSENAAQSSEAANPSPAALPPSSPSHFVGKWASNASECGTKSWLFTARSLSVAGGPHCSFYKVSPAPGGYNIAATCPTKQPVHTDLIKLRFAGPQSGMLVESNAIPPTGLVRCGK